jgi:2-isopropylmalate synthase
MRPSDVGRQTNALVLGKHSGRHAFVNRLRELGIDLEKIDVNEAFARFKELATRRRTCSTTTCTRSRAKKAVHPTTTS